MDFIIFCRGEEIVCNLVAASRLPLGRPPLFAITVCDGPSGTPVPTANFLFFRRGDQWSPAVIHDNRSFSGRRGRRPLRGIIRGGFLMFHAFYDIQCVSARQSANNICRGRRPRRPALKTRRNNKKAPRRKSAEGCPHSVPKTTVLRLRGKLHFSTCNGLQMLMILLCKLTFCLPQTYP